MRVAIVGATGAVGREMTSCLFELGLAVDELVLLSSQRSGGTMVATPKGDSASWPSHGALTAWTWCYVGRRRGKPGARS